MEKEVRPWGFYEVILDEQEYKVKRITVFPNHILSLQSHLKRAEHWFIIEGQAKVFLDNQNLFLEKNEVVDIPKGTKHRIENIGKDKLVFIEIQTGEYFGEDDIIRYQDIYGREK